jgi:hypothetical protein
MKTITINRKEYNISAPLERVILRVWQAGPQAISDFEEGQYRRHRVNHVARNEHRLPAMTGGALQIAHIESGKVPAQAAKKRPRVTRWVLPADVRRLNLVIRKLANYQQSA